MSRQFRRLKLREFRKAQRIAAKVLKRLQEAQKPVEPPKSGYYYRNHTVIENVYEP